MKDLFSPPILGIYLHFLSVKFCLTNNFLVYIQLVPSFVHLSPISSINKLLIKNKSSSIIYLQQVIKISAREIICFFVHVVLLIFLKAFYSAPCTGARRVLDILTAFSLLFISIFDDNFLYFSSFAYLCHLDDNVFIGMTTNCCCITDVLWSCINYLAVLVTFSCILSLLCTPLFFLFILCHCKKIFTFFQLRHDQFQHPGPFCIYSIVIKNSLF